MSLEMLLFVEAQKYEGALQTVEPNYLFGTPSLGHC